MYKDVTQRADEGKLDTISGSFWLTHRMAHTARGMWITLKERGNSEVLLVGAVCVNKRLIMGLGESIDFTPRHR